MARCLPQSTAFPRTTTDSHLERVFAPFVEFLSPFLGMPFFFEFLVRAVPRIFLFDA